MQNLKRAVKDVFGRYLGLIPEMLAALILVGYAFVFPIISWILVLKVWSDYELDEFVDDLANYEGED